MPKAVQDFLGYKIYFWSNDHTPIHVHVSIGAPSENSPEFEFINGDVIPTEQALSTIPSNELVKIKRYLQQNRAQIIQKWYDCFGEA